MKISNIYSLLFILFFLSANSLFIFSSADDSEVEDESHFTYTEGTENGPENWGHVDPKWKVCNTGKLQSPIDLVDRRVKVGSDLRELRRNYKSAPAVLKNRGHDIIVEWKGDAGNAYINGSDYDLKQCHWHSPSEHTMNGKRYSLETHMVHTNSQGHLAVIGILYKIGRPDPFLSQIIHHTTTVGEEGIELGAVNPWDLKFGSRKYYRYLGSLTVPPCTEGVTWTIIKKVRTVSREQLRELRKAVDDGYESNARPTQPLHAREAKLYRPEN